jgi:CRISPR-associated protein Cas2
MEELRTLVIYDIEDDKIRLRISETCLDYGLTRIQYSAFLGTLNRNKREELFLRLTSVLDNNPGKIFLQPICDKDVKDVLIKENEKRESRTCYDFSPRERHQTARLLSAGRFLPIFDARGKEGDLEDGAGEDRRGRN